VAAWLTERLGVDGHALVQAGSVTVGGARVRDPETALVAGVTVIVHTGAVVPSREWRVVTQTHDVLVVDKPAGLPVQATREAAGALDEQVAATEPEARLLHRIDRETSGLVMFTRRAAARGPMQRALEAGRILRVYLAVVEGAPAWETLTIDRPLGPDPADHLKQRVGAGERAVTHVEVVRRGASSTLVRARLGTGRTHQIRAHLAAEGHPVLGDPLYGDPARAPRLALHATLLRWPGGEAESPLPDELSALL
jgi:23S rRNA pseudouridine1911/1915/1917 synthase